MLSASRVRNTIAKFKLPSASPGTPDADRIAALEKAVEGLTDLVATISVEVEDLGKKSQAYESQIQRLRR